MLILVWKFWFLIQFFQHGTDHFGALYAISVSGEMLNLRLSMQGIKAFGLAPSRVILYLILPLWLFIVLFCCSDYGRGFPMKMMLVFFIVCNLQSIRKVTYSYHFVSWRATSFAISAEHENQIWLKHGVLMALFLMCPHSQISSSPSQPDAPADSKESEESTLFQFSEVWQIWL